MADKKISELTQKTPLTTADNLMVLPVFDPNDSTVPNKKISLVDIKNYSAGAITSSVGTANGIASLDGSAKLPAAQLPTTAQLTTDTLADTRITGTRFVQTTSVGAASGLATLDSNSKLTASQIPSTVQLNTDTIADTRLTGSRYVLSSSVGAPLGITPLDSTSRVPYANLQRGLSNTDQSSTNTYIDENYFNQSNSLAKYRQKIFAMGSSSSVIAKIVCLGDSNTEKGGNTNSYPTFLQTRLQQDTGFGNQVQIINAGYSGDNIASLSNRVAIDANNNVTITYQSAPGNLVLDATVTNPDVVIIMVGTNDASGVTTLGQGASAPQAFYDKYVSLVKKLQKAGIEVVLVTLIPSFQYVDNKHGNYINIIKQIGAKFDIPVADANDYFMKLFEYNFYKNTDIYKSDGIHLDVTATNNLGYQLLAEFICATQLSTRTIVITDRNKWVIPLGYLNQVRSLGPNTAVTTQYGGPNANGGGRVLQLNSTDPSNYSVDINIFMMVPNMSLNLYSKKDTSGAKINLLVNGSIAKNINYNNAANPLFGVYDNVLDNLDMRNQNIRWQQTQFTSVGAAYIDTIVIEPTRLPVADVAYTRDRTLSPATPPSMRVLRHPDGLTIKEINFNSGSVADINGGILFSRPPLANTTGKALVIRYEGYLANNGALIWNSNYSAATTWPDQTSAYCFGNMIYFTSSAANMGIANTTGAYLGTIASATLSSFNFTIPHVIQIEQTLSNNTTKVFIDDATFTTPSITSTDPTMFRFPAGYYGVAGITSNVAFNGNFTVACVV